MEMRGFLGYSGSLLWRGDFGSSSPINESRSDLGPTTGGAAQLVFTAAIEPYSECNLSHHFIFLTYDQTTGAPGTGANIDRKAVIYFRDPDNLEVLHFDYPAPLTSQIESTPWGKRVKYPVVVDITALLSTLKGQSLIPLYGSYYERK